MEALLKTERKNFHKFLLESKTLSSTKDNVASNADSSNRTSKLIALDILQQIEENCKLEATKTEKLSGQTLGSQFESAVKNFVTNTFSALEKIRPGKWNILQLGNNNKLKTSDFAQYEHLAYLSSLTAQDHKLAAVLGNDYLVAPDIVIYRDLCSDELINKDRVIVDNDVGLFSSLRKKNGGKPILHASISAKFTMRSDRAQNSRTEALNLIRNRKGHLPHIVVVTAEPTPSRLASLALGTGDIDCVYHFALNELQCSVENLGSDDSKDLLNTLILGKRIKDISDLPLDLAV